MAGDKPRGVWGTVRHAFISAVSYGLKKEVVALAASGLGFAWYHYRKGFFLVGGGITLFVALFLWIRRWLQERFVYRPFRLVPMTGLSRVWPVKPLVGGTGNEKISIDERDNAEKALSEAIRNTQEIRLLLVSGWRHIGCEKYPGILWKALTEGRERAPTIEILLMDPSVSSSRSSKAGLESPDRYQRGAQAVLYTLGILKRRYNASITVRLYNEDPIWQMVFTRDELWLMCVANVATGNSPIYCLTRSAKYALAFGLEAVWERRWAGAKMFDLDGPANRVEPDWDRLQDTTQASQSQAAR